MVRRLRYVVRSTKRRGGTVVPCRWLVVMAVVVLFRDGRQMRAGVLRGRHRAEPTACMCWTARRRWRTNSYRVEKAGSINFLPRTRTWTGTRGHVRWRLTRRYWSRRLRVINPDQSVLLKLVKLVRRHDYRVLAIIRPSGFEARGRC